MFLSIGWYHFKSVEVPSNAVGVVFVFITFLSLLINIGSVCNGMTTCYKTLIKWWWIIALVVMGIL